MIINTAYGSKSVCSIYNIAINKICPNDIFKIIFDNEKLFKIALVSFYKKDNSNTSAYGLSLMWVWMV